MLSLDHGICLEKLIILLIQRIHRLYGHVAHLPDEDPAHGIILARKKTSKWSRPLGLKASQHILVGIALGWEECLPRGLPGEDPGRGATV